MKTFAILFRFNCVRWRVQAASPCERQITMQEKAIYPDFKSLVVLNSKNVGSHMQPDGISVSDSACLVNIKPHPVKLHASYF